MSRNIQQITAQVAVEAIINDPEAYDLRTMQDVAVVAFQYQDIPRHHLDQLRTLIREMEA